MRIVDIATTGDHVACILAEMGSRVSALLGRNAFPIAGAGKGHARAWKATFRP